MNIYRLLSVYTRIKSTRVKALALLVLHVLHRKYTCLFFDPVLSCNLRCRMCYFSDAEKRKRLHGRFTQADIEAIAKGLFPHLRKLQIGCGAEPALYNDLAAIVGLAKANKVPYISITTNGNLLNYDKLVALVKGGLDEITLSAHGFTKDNYEYFMAGADFGRLLQLINDLKQIKSAYPRFKVRINYTVNERNVGDLAKFPAIFDGLHVDTLQVRPIQKIGESEYCNFSMDGVLRQYDSVITPLVKFCSQQGTRCIYPTKENIAALHMGVDVNETENSNGIVDMMPHFYMSPWEGWKQQYDPYKEDFYKYCRRTKRVALLLKEVLCPSHAESEDVTKTMNYEVK